MPAASAAVKVGAVQLYSWPSTVIHGYLVSNWLTWRLKASKASCVLPGRRLATVMVTGLWSAVLGAGAAEPAAPVGAAVGLAALAAGVVVAELQALSTPAIVTSDAISVDRRLVRVIIRGSPLLELCSMLAFVGGWTSCATKAPPHD